MNKLFFTISLTLTLAACAGMGHPSPAPASAKKPVATKAEAKPATATPAPVQPASAAAPPAQAAPAAKAEAPAAPTTRYSCFKISLQQARALYAQGHTYLDRDGDGRPCEWPDKAKELEDESASKPASKCTTSKAYTKADGTKVPARTQCN